MNNRYKVNYEDSSYLLKQFAILYKENKYLKNKINKLDHNSIINNVS
jgi:hypothetical protein